MRPAVAFLRLVPLFCGSIGIAAGSAAEAPPAHSKFYPFGDRDLAAVRTVVAAERIAESQDVNRAWDIFGELNMIRQGRRHDLAEPTAQLDALKASLRPDDLPEWFIKLRANPPAADKVVPAASVTDARFAQQKETTETQRLKALGMVYLMEIMLGREGALSRARAHLDGLVARTGWDYELHFLCALVAGTEKDADRAWRHGCLCLYLNPQPHLSYADPLARAGAKTRPQEWPEIKVMLREACEGTVAEVTILSVERELPDLKPVPTPSK